MDNFKSQGFIVVISSPSGCGKTTLANMLLSNDSNLKKSISVTTRLKRKGEIEGKDYFFTTEKQYKEMVAKDLLLEHAQVFDHFYGIPSQHVEKVLKQGKDVLCVIDWQGGVSLMKKIKRQNIVSIFILPPSLAILKKRLIDRKTDSEKVINNRLSEAKHEISKCVHYDYVVINNKLEQCADQLKAILTAERLKRARQDIKALIGSIEKKGILS